MYNATTSQLPPWGQRKEAFEQRWPLVEVRQYIMTRGQMTFLVQFRKKQTIANFSKTTYCTRNYLIT